MTRPPLHAALCATCLVLVSACAADTPVAESTLTITDVGRYAFVGGDSEDPSRVAEELSGLDWLSGNRYVAVSDEHACLYSLTIDVDSLTGEITSASFLEPLVLTGADGADLAGAVGDREGVAIERATNSVWISHEESAGERTHSTICQHSLESGEMLRRIETGADPALAVFAAGRSNRGFESLAGHPDGSEYWTANEEALVADGDTATPERGTTIRLQRFDRDFTPTAQYAYVAQPVSGPIVAPEPFAGDGIGGVVDIEVLPDGTLLVLERAFAGDADGLAGNTIGIYEADVSRATDITGVKSLRDADFEPVAKRQLIELHFPFSNSNFEGITLGPKLENGDRSLILIADNHSGTHQALYALRLSGLEE